MVDEGLGIAMMETFSSSMRTKALTRTQGKTREKFSNAILHYFEIFYNHHRRRSHLDYTSPIELEFASSKQLITV